MTAKHQIRNLVDRPARHLDRLPLLTKPGLQEEEFTGYCCGLYGYFKDSFLWKVHDGGLSPFLSLFRVAPEQQPKLPVRREYDETATKIDLPAVAAVCGNAFAEQRQCVRSSDRRLSGGIYQGYLHRQHHAPRRHDTPEPGRRRTAQFFQ